MSVGDENIAIRRDDDIRRPIESLRAVAGDSWLAERHQDSSIRTELEDLVAFAVFSVAIGHPHVSFLVHADAVRKHEHAGAEASQELARWIEFENGRQVRTGAAVSAAPLRDPYAIVRLDARRACYAS